MKKITLSFLTWYLLADFVPCAISATLPVKSDRETKLKKREPCVIEWSLQDSLELLAQQENKNMGMLFSQSRSVPVATAGDEDVTSINIPPLRPMEKAI
ncbi:hypothetical protein HF521_003692 [Silurus meridionalis]|uniref:Uncharacterized protein n=1 Tax=Silurus meridionalis TaxID=175797 RepID=A0A8T0AZ35_SILME|nr:hypothetical protein HF521_003692 [Silurus meridionalis]